MGDRQGVRDHHSLTPTQDRGGNPLTGSLPPLCLRVPIPTAMGKQEPHTCGFLRRPSHPHQGGERIRMAFAPDSDT